VIPANLGVSWINRGVRVVAIAVRLAVAVGHTVAIRIAQLVIALSGGFHARIDGAGVTVVAIHDRSLLAPDHRIADLDAVAEDSILAARIVRDELAAMDLVVARIERTIDTVVTLGIFEAWTAESRFR
jgi:hypothetical protein